MFLGLKSTGSHGRIIRLVLQPHLKRVGMDWEDVDSLLKDLREDDLKKCSKPGNLGPILQNILPRMAFQTHLVNKTVQLVGKIRFPLTKGSGWPYMMT